MALIDQETPCCTPSSTSDRHESTSSSSSSASDGGESPRSASPSTFDTREQPWKKLLQAEQKKGGDRPWNEWKPSEKQPFEKPWINWGIEFGVDNFRTLGGS